MFQSPLGEVVKETPATEMASKPRVIPAKFQSPLGEVVKETYHMARNIRDRLDKVSIPSRGSGKGDVNRDVDQRLPIN